MPVTAGQQQQFETAEDEKKRLEREERDRIKGRYGEVRSGKRG